jgi:hypothetical protein
MTRNIGLVFILGYIVLGLAACGSGGVTTSTNSSESPHQHGDGVVAVEVVTESGAPVPHVGVSVAGTFGYREATTGADALTWAGRAFTGHAAASLSTRTGLRN